MTVRPGMAGADGMETAAVGPRVADDLVTSAAINREVFTATEQGVVTSATIIANAPAFDDAVADACGSTAITRRV